MDGVQGLWIYGETPGPPRPGTTSRLNNLLGLHSSPQPTPMRFAVGLFGIGLAVLVWLPLGLAGVPLDTPDGFLHLGWAAGWARQMAGGWWWPQWSDLNWAGAGSFALAIYPPLFRWFLGLPLLLGIPPDHALALALLAILLLHAGGVIALALVWLQPGWWRWLLVCAASLNPYFLVNLYVRGAWPEALAQGCLWWFALGLVGVRRQYRWGLPLAALAVAGVVWSNWNAALLLLVMWGAAIVGLASGQEFTALKRWMQALGLGLALASPFWVPALQLMPQLRPPVPAGLYPWEFFAAGAASEGSFGRLLWIQALVIVVLLAIRWLGWGRRSDGLGLWGLALAAGALLMMVPLSQPIYGLVTPLQRIQFPWRWLGPGWCGALLWLCSPGALNLQLTLKQGWRRGALALGGAAALGGWFDAVWRFRTNVVGHAPTSQERQAMRQLLACDPLEPCPRGVNALKVGGELAKRFKALPDGRIALAGMPDYAPAAVPEHAWQKRLQTFWLPAWPQARWAELNKPGNATLLNHQPTERLLVAETTGPNTLRLMQWAHPLWRVQMRPAPSTERPSPPWSTPLPAGGLDQDGWISIPLPPGRWEVALTYGRTR